MAVKQNVLSFRSSGRRLRVTQAITSALRPSVEAMERRTLLAAYSLGQLAYLGVNATGADPRSQLVFDAGGNLYGTAAGGGAFGAGNVFEIAKGTATITTVASFNYANGAAPHAGVTFDSAGNLYGTTSLGGTYGDGTVFEIARGSNSITSLVSFNGENGQDPEAAVVLDAAGDLYGTTKYGGASNDGIIFTVAKGTNAVTTVTTFTGPNGSSPVAPLTLDTSGNFYGTTRLGGSGGGGTLFEVARGSSAITTLVSFDQNVGEFPEKALIADSSGNFYGTTTQIIDNSISGRWDGGTIFEMGAGSTSITTLATFVAYSENSGVTFDSGGNLYGALTTGGNGGTGSVFELPHGSTTMTTVAQLSLANAYPQCGLTFDATGNIYDTAPEQAGNTIAGSVFEIAKGSTTVKTVAAFAWINATGSYGPLTFDASGNLFGTNSQGGTSDNGMIFEIAKGSMATTTLVSFPNQAGGGPAAGVTFDASGNLYGTTSSGDGTVFEVAKGTYAITTLASFAVANGAPRAGVTLDGSGNIFGTTPLGGAHGDGTVFEIPKGTNAITTVASFNGTNGNNPDGAVTFDASGNLYGTTFAGGTNSDGTVFEIANGSSTITTLVSFNVATYGWAPVGGVVVDASGNLYGTTSYGNKTVFEIAHGSSTLTGLASLTTGSSYEYAGLAIDSSGNLFGTTEWGGANGDGAVFELARGSSAITVLHSFDGADGSQLYAGVTLDASGNLYGTTMQGGADINGSAFELTRNPVPAVTLSLAVGSNPSTVGQALTFAATVSGGVPDGEPVSLGSV